MRQVFPFLFASHHWRRRAPRCSVLQFLVELCKLSVPKEKSHSYFSKSRFLHSWWRMNPAVDVCMEIVHDVSQSTPIIKRCLASCISMLAWRLATGHAPCFTGDKTEMIIWLLLYVSLICEHATTISVLQLQYTPTTTVLHQYFTSLNGENISPTILLL